VNGFQIATSGGPLCAEPMTGLAFIIEDVVFKDTNEVDVSIGGVFSGQVTSAVSTGCVKAFLMHPVRIVEPLYLCDLNVSTQGLSKAHQVLLKRRAKIIEEYPRPSTDIFSITAHLPVVESFGFSTQIRKSTSGGVDWQLVFSHWEMLDEDPFFVPKTKEEKEEFGEFVEGLPPSTPKKIIDDVRARKGLFLKKKGKSGEKNKPAGSNV